MGKHSAPLRRTAAHENGSGRRKVWLGIAAAGVATALLIGGQGTFAFWTDSATVTSGTITSGTLDLKVDGDQGKPAYAKTTLAMSAMLPGESVAVNIAVTNAGEASFTWVPTVSKGGDLGGALQVDFYRGATVDGTSPRKQVCKDGTTLTSGQTASTLPKGAAAQNLCVQVTLPTTTGNVFQGKTTGSVTITLAADQVLLP